MPNDRLDGHVEASSSFRLRVMRVEEGESFHLRTLSKALQGFFTHYLRPSVYCPGAECTCQHNKKQRLWKGYIAVEQWHLDSKLWIPHILEITEHLELDFRGKYAAGQVWIVKRPQPLNKKKQPVTGVLVEVLKPGTYPPAFEILPTLKHVYHSSDVQLVHKNPLPDRTVVCPSTGAPPKDIAESESVPFVPVTEEQRKKMRDFARGIFRPVEEGNGRS